jgi:twitching motility protein PilT
MISGAIAAGTSQYGMQTFDQAIFGLYSQGMVTLEEALRWASNVDDFKLKVAGIATTSDLARDNMAAQIGVTPKPGAAGPQTSAKPGTQSVPTIDRFGRR